ncbi:hypothetical protein EWM64_g8150 [Hericium alpestre]|uniref:Uncharacterized protein n=1 Tax=Hericium alpestre TaxID=135208 RepID=A0A4Y9ZPV8_9AGAM|nr:hypothetical protein EWM64_g8150 [Hericium alpestre]
MDSPQLTGLDPATFLRGCSRRNKSVQDVVMAHEDPAPGNNAVNIPARKKDP